jgi:nicotinamidase-related amidase
MSQSIQVIHALIDIHAVPFPTCRYADRLAGIAATMKSNSSEELAKLLEGGLGDYVTFTRIPGHVSALKSPGLDDFLQKNGSKSLVLTGLGTSGWLGRTAITACDAEYVVTVISDGCADPVEVVHDFMLGKFLNNRGYVTTAAEFQGRVCKAYL